jgi:hypothetical protein
MVSSLTFPWLYSPIKNLREYELASLDRKVKAIQKLIPIGHLINLQLVKVHQLILKVDGDGVNGDILL